jgi:hypothetical protein
MHGNALRFGQFFPQGTKQLSDLPVFPVYYGIGLPLPDAMRWFFRVRKWSLAGGITAECVNAVETWDAAFDFTTAFFQVECDNGSGWIALTSEQDYIRFLPIDSGGVSGLRMMAITVDGTPSPILGTIPNATLTCLINAFNFGAQEELSNVPLFYPPMECRIVVSDTGGLIIDNYFQTAHAAGELSIDGNALPLFSNAPTNPVSGITIAPMEYWEYRDSHGTNPIYNSATGSELITPVPRGL